MIKNVILKVATNKVVRTVAFGLGCAAAGYVAAEVKNIFKVKKIIEGIKTNVDKVNGDYAEALRTVSDLQETMESLQKENSDLKSGSNKGEAKVGNEDDKKKEDENKGGNSGQGKGSNGKPKGAVK